MMKPAITTKELIHRRVEILVVGELDMATHVPGEPPVVDERCRQASWVRRSLKEQPVDCPKFIESPRGTQTGRTCADDEDIDSPHWVLVKRTAGRPKGSSSLGWGGSVVATAISGTRMMSACPVGNVIGRSRLSAKNSSTASFSPRQAGNP